MTVPDSEQYWDFLQRVSLSAINLKSLSFEKPNLPGNVSIDLNSDEIAYHMDDNGILHAQLEVELTIRKHVPHDNQGSDDPADCESQEEGVTFLGVTFEIQYDMVSEERPSDEIISKLFNMHIPLHVWPYVRELISSMTLRAGLPPLMLPLYVKTI